MSQWRSLWRLIACFPATNDLIIHRGILIEMTPSEPIPKKPLRLWPGVVAAVLLGVVRFIVPVVFADATMFAVLGGLVGALVVVLWWVFFSRAAWFERL